MLFDPENNVVRLCAQGMEAEGNGDLHAARQLFSNAWENSTNDFEKFTAAHYMARHQPYPEEELKWNLIALEFANTINIEEVKSYLPSLHLNVGKSYESLQDAENALKHYQLAEKYIIFLSDDGYGNMIRSGISTAIKRVDLKT